MSKLIGERKTVQHQKKRKLGRLEINTGLSKDASVRVSMTLLQGVVDGDLQEIRVTEVKDWVGIPGDLITQGILTPDEVSTLAGLIAKAGDNLGDVLFGEVEE